MKAEIETKTEITIKGITLHLTRNEALALCAIHGQAYSLDPDNPSKLDSLGPRVSRHLFNCLTRILTPDILGQDYHYHPIYQEVKAQITRPLDFRDLS